MTVLGSSIRSLCMCVASGLIAGLPTWGHVTCPHLCSFCWDQTKMLNVELDSRFWKQCGRHSEVSKLGDSAVCR